MSTYLTAWIVGAALVGFAGMSRKMGYGGAFLVALGLGLLPLAGHIGALVIVNGSARKQPRGCAHCGNTANDAEFCALCGKNAAVEVRVDIRSR
jgi:hypothetical protein